MKKQKIQVKKLKIGKETLLALQAKEVVGGDLRPTQKPYPFFNTTCQN
jgi:hypothetical protein